MGSPRHRLLRMGRRGRARGLVLVEVMLFLLVIVLAVGLVALALGRVRHGTRLNQFGSELQAFAAAFKQARAERGRWPATAAEAGPGVVDAGWSDSSVFGGEYGWVAPAGGRPGMITLTAFAPNFPLGLTRADLLAIDRQIDDGDLKAGRFRTGFNGWPVYLIPE